MRQREYEQDGHTHKVIEVDAELVGHDLTRGTASFVRARRGPQAVDLAREAVVATELSGDGDTRSTCVTDGSGWAVPGLAAPAAEPAADPAA
jgi:hypothetical protein